MARPEPLVPHDQVVTVAERTGPDGRAVVELTDEEIGRVVGEVERADPESIAISLLFSYAGTEHERRLTAALERLGVPISRSSALLPPTCVLNAAMEPVMRRYLSNLSSRLPEPKITVMTSSGGTAGAAGAYPNRYLVKQRCRVKDAPVERRRWSRESSESDDARLMAITLTELSVSGRARPPSKGGVAQAALSA